MTKQEKHEIVKNLSEKLNENNIFYRLTSGTYDDTGLIEAENVGNAIEYNFNTKS